MKKLLYLVLILPLFLQSCLLDDNDVFDKPSAQRLEEAIEEYKKALVDAPNGWLLQYYPDKDQAYGGYNYIISFTKEEVTAMFELANLDESLTSLYRVRAEQGPILSFDTYNNFLHMFATPSQAQYRAMGGDFEFVMMGIEGDQIKLRGKRSHNNMTLTKIAVGQDHEALLEKIVDMEENISSLKYAILVGGKATTSIALSDRHFTIKEDAESNPIDAPFIVTTEGIRFYNPITVFGKEMQNFKYIEASDELVCTDGVDAIIKKIAVPLNEVFSILPFYFGYNKVGPALTAPFASMKNALVNATSAYRLHNLWLGPDYYDNISSIAFAVWDIPSGRDWMGAFIYELTPIVGTENELTLRFTNTYDSNGNAGAFIGMAPGFKTFPESLGGTYTLTSTTPATPKYPRGITLVDNTNPDRWFTLSMNAIDLR